MLRRVLPPQFLDLLEAHQPWIVVAPQAFVVPVDHLAQNGDGFAELQRLVHLLLIVRQQEHRIRVIDDIAEFEHVGIGEDGCRDAARAPYSDFRPVEFRVVFADDGDGLAALQSKTDHAEAKITDVLVDFVPAIFLPDAKTLLAHCHPVTKLLHP